MANRIVIPSGRLDNFFRHHPLLLFNEAVCHRPFASLQKGERPFPVGDDILAHGRNSASLYFIYRRRRTEIGAKSLHFSPEFLFLRRNDHKPKLRLL